MANTQDKKNEKQLVIESRGEKKIIKLPGAGANNRSKGEMTLDEKIDTDLDTLIRDGRLNK